MLKMHFVAKGNLRQPKQDFQKAIKNASSSELEFPPLIPEEPDLSLYLDCAELPYPCPICNSSVELSEASIQLLKEDLSEYQAHNIQGRPRFEEFLAKKRRGV
jgi:hypothetical protein